MASWYDEYQGRLDKYRSSSRYAPVLDYASVAGIDSTGLDLPHNPGVGERLMDLGGRALDILSRPGYATGSFLNDILSDSVNGPNNVNSFDAAIEGLTGKRKEFFNPFQILDPYQEGESGLESGARFATDFLASVLTDPLTLIPGSAALKGARAVGKASGITKGVDKLRELSRPELTVKNVPQLPKELTDVASPVINGADEIPITQVSDVPPVPQRDFANTEVGTSPLRPVDVPTLNPATKTAQYVPDDKAQALIQHLLTGGKVNAVNGTDLAGRLFAAQSVRTGLTDALANVKGRLFRDGEFDNPWRDVQAAKTPRPEPIKPTFDTELVEPKPTVTQAGNVAQKLDTNVIVRSMVDAAAESGTKEEMLKLSKIKGNEKKVFYAEDTDEVIKNGSAVSPYKIAEKYAGKPLSEFMKKNPQARVAFQDEIGDLKFVTPGMYAKMLKGEFPLRDLEGKTIAKQGEAMPAEEYFQSRRTKWTQANEVPPSAEDMAAFTAEKARRDEAMKNYETEYNAWKDEQLGIPSITREKPTKDAKISWLEKYSDKITEADKKTLRNLMGLGNEKGFLAKIDEIMQREGTLDLDTIDALHDAVKSGRVPMDVANELFAKMGVSTFGQAKKRLQQIDDQITRLEGRGATLTSDRPRTQSFQGAQSIPAPTIKPMEITKFKPGTPLGQAQARTIIKDASTIDPNTLSPEILDITIQSLKDAMNIEFKKAREKMVYPRRARGAKGDTVQPYAGAARYLEEYNVYSQLTHWKALQAAISKHIPIDESTGKSILGYKRGKYMYDRMMPALKASDDTLRAYGIQPSAMPGGKGIPLSVYDILSGLPEDWVIKHIFAIGRRDAKDLSTSTGRQVTLTQLFNIAEQAVRETPGELADFNRMFLREGLDFGDNRIVNSASGYSQAKGMAAQARAEKNIRKQQKIPEGEALSPDNMRSAIKQRISTEERIFGETIDPISSKDFIDHITNALEQNRKSAGMQADTFVKKAEYAAVTKFIDDIAAASTQSEVFSLIDNARKGVPGFLRDTADIVPPPGAAAAIQEGVDLATSNFGTELATKAGKEFDAAKTSSESARVATKVDDAIDSVTSKMLDDGTIPMVNLGDPAVYRKIRQWDTGPMMKALAAYFPHLSEGKARQVWLASNNSSTFIANHFAKSLSKLQRRIGTKDDTARIFQALQHGEQVTSTDQAAVQEFKKVLDMVFDTENGSMGFLQRNGIDPRHVNSHLKHFGIDPAQFGLHGEGSAAYQSWKNWENVDDPLDLLSKFFQASSRAYGEKSLGSSLSQRFGFKEKHPGDDFVKIQAGGSRISHLIDRDLWYPRSVAENFKALDKTLYDIAKPPRSNQFARIFDSLTHKYKTGLTIYRPGHHLRNMYGDIWLSYMDGVRSPKYYNQAQKVLASRKNYYDDPILDTRVSDLTYNPKGTAVTMKTPGGKQVHLSYDDVYKLSVSQGILHDYSTIEDLGLLNAVDDIDKVQSGRSITRPFNGKLHEKVTGISEYRDHYVRMAHLMSLIERDKNKFRLLERLPNEHPEAQLRRSLERQFEEYSARIRKWHPDGSDLTLWEKRVMRRGILFYSWIRKAVPLVLESMLTRPGRFLTFPKAMYNLAEANGIDLNGLSDPFPADQMFPAWMGDLQGPQFGGPGKGYMGLRPGVPGIDILDQYFESPGEGFKTALTGLHPLFKVPIELVQGKNMQGIPIKDVSSYALGQIPFGNLANTTAGWALGSKPIGSTAPSNDVYDSLSSGWKDPAAIAWINFLTGAGLLDMSKPSYVKAAQFDDKYGRLG